MSRIEGKVKLQTDLATAEGDPIAGRTKETQVDGGGGDDASGSSGGGGVMPPTESNLESKFEGLNLCGEEEELDLSGEVDGL